MAVSKEQFDAVRTVKGKPLTQADVDLIKRAFEAAPVAPPAGVTYPSIDTLLSLLTTTSPIPLGDADINAAANALGVAPAIIRAIRKVEAPRGPFDATGRPSILYERHVFARNTSPKGKFNASHPALSGAPYGPGGYGPFSAQYTRLAAAYKLDPAAAIEACSWGAFQVLGENWAALGYSSPLNMALSLTKTEAGHLDSFVRFVKANHLVDELQRCRPGQPDSWIGFVASYNGPGFRQFNYHIKAAEAAL